MSRNYLILIILILTAACTSQDDDAAQSAAQPVVLVEVDGSPVTLPMLELVMEARGVDENDHARMRELLDELIGIQVVANAARAEGLDEDARVAAGLRLAEIQTLYRHYLDRAGRAAPISDADILAVYEAQLERSGDTQYRIEIIAYPDQAKAQLALKRLADGEIDYSSLRAQALADDLNVDEPGWIDRSQVPGDFAAALAETDAGSVVPEPLGDGQVWYLVRVLETRDLQVPSFDEVRAGIARSLEHQQRQAVVESLYDRAKITPMLPLGQAETPPDEPPGEQGSQGK